MKNFNKGKFLTSLVIVILVAIIIGAGYVWGKTELDKYKRNWPAIQFAMQQPDLVMALSEDYASKSAELKANYLKKELTPSEQLMQAVAEKVETSKTSK